MTQDEWFTPTEVARIAKVTKWTVWRWIRPGTLKGTHVGNRRTWRVRAQDLASLLDIPVSRRSLETKPRRARTRVGRKRTRPGRDAR